MNKNNLEEVNKKIQSLGHWFQHIDLGNGIKTITEGKPGGYDPQTRWQHLEKYVPDDLSGKTVLDLGCNAGFFSLQMAKRGAEKIVGVDPFQEHIDQTKFISEWFDFDIELIKQDAHVFCLTTEERFDYIIFLGVLYHLKYGLIVLDRLAEMTKERLYFQSQTFESMMDSFNPEPNYNIEQDGKNITSSKNFPRMYFIENSYGGDFTNWWFPNDTCIEGFLRSSGLKIVARPHRRHYILEPALYLGKKIYPGKLVFPIHGNETRRLPI